MRYPWHGGQRAVRSCVSSAIDHLATDHSAIWQTSDSYNPQRPLTAIDRLAIAIGNDTEE